MYNGFVPISFIGVGRSLISEEFARDLWEAMGEDPNYSPSLDDLLLRARMLANTTKHCEEEHAE